MTTSTQSTSLFPNAQADVEAPARKSDVVAAERQAFISKHKTILIVWLAVAISPTIVGLVMGITGDPTNAIMLIIGGLMSAVLLIAVPALVMYLVIAHRARRAYWRLYAEARGLQLAENSGVAASVPLLSRGDERKYPFLVSGAIGPTHSTFGLYTYTEISESTDSDGNSTEQRKDYNFTLAVFELPAAVAQRYSGVYVRPRSAKLGFGGLQDKLGHDREVRLESSEFQKKRELRVWDEQDDVAVYELFSTTFIDGLNTDLDVYWEQVGPQLVVFRRKHIEVAVELDDLIADGLRVYQRYCEEYQ